ncbi:slr1306 family protein [Synechocystis sp. PCC 7509]|uniref:slr1306 family protein n=1 Tax=Synechocystis sp. PCC 7509 TaxID=927677 RepID=UPI0002AD124B|nr:DUF697 domain-containing protein [Synechocystis sp. PCC 7509]
MVGWRRPILVGGVGLSLLLWLWQSFDSSVGQLSEWGMLSTIALGTCLWLWQQNKLKKATVVDNSPPNREKVEKALALANNVINQLQAEAVNHAALSLLQEQFTKLNDDLERQELNIAIIGGKAVGKTSLLQALSTWENTSNRPVTFQETKPLFTPEKNTVIEASYADLVIFVTSGDFTDSEWQVWQQMRSHNQRIVLVFNKQDQYLPDARANILSSLQQKVIDVVATSSNPNLVKVRQHQSDDSVREWLDKPAADISELSNYLQQVVVKEGRELIWTTTIRQAVNLQIKAKTVLNQVRQQKAIPIIEQYQWIAAAAAFANPVPALDLLATAAINAQLVVELGNIYQQKFSFQQAQTVAGTMGSLMLKLGLVELSTKAIATLLKSNVVTFVAGGAIQGVSAAYLTRVAGLSLIEYFSSQEVATSSESGLNLDKLGQTLQKVFQQNQQVALLQSFVQQGISRLSPESQVKAKSSVS